MGKQQQQREVSSWAGLATTVYDEQAEGKDFIQRGTAVAMESGEFIVGSVHAPLSLGVPEV